MQNLSNANSVYGTWVQNAAEFSLNVSLQFTSSTSSSIQAQQLLEMYASNNETISTTVPKGFSCLIDPSLIQISG